MLTLLRLILAPLELSIAVVKLEKLALLIDSVWLLLFRIIPLPLANPVIVNPLASISREFPFRVSGFGFIELPIDSFASRA